MLPLIIGLLLFGGWAVAGANEGGDPGRQKATVLLVTGVDYPGHVWRQTAPVLAQALSQDKRLEVFTVEDPRFLDSTNIHRYDLILLHFQNWQQPGPDIRALSTPGVQELYRRGCAWAAGLGPE